MKKLAVVLITLYTSFTAFAQTGISINGVVADGRHGVLEAATVSLLQAKDSAVKKITVTGKNGSYAFEAISSGDYLVAVSSTGYESVMLPVSPKANTLVRMDTVFLAAAPKSLDNVTVTNKKPLIEQKADRMVVNVDASVTNIGLSALEVLEQSPGVMVDKDGNISLKGKSDVVIFIDGKPSYLGGAELASLLSNMSASQLSQLEIMTNPSSKFDAAGNAGIINIKTKKSLVKGFNAAITLSYSQGEYPKTNNSVVMNYRTEKMNLFLTYGYNLNKGFMNFDINRNFINTSGIKTSSLEQLSERLNKATNNNLKIGADYFVNPATTIGFAISGFINPQEQKAYTTSYVKDATGDITSIEKTNRLADNQWKNGNANINLRIAPAGGKKELTASLDYLAYHFTGQQNISSYTYNPSNTLLADNYLSNSLPLDINILSGRLDYSYQFPNGIKGETGLKSSFTQTNNQSDFYRMVNSVWIADTLLSNSFHYKENINAAYVNLNKKYGDWTIQLGLRLEATNSRGTQSSLQQKTDSAFSRNFLNIFPTSFISYEVNKNNLFSLSVGRRIDRPAYQQLNPFVSFIDKYTYSTGNPFLQPQYSTNFEINHSYKNLLTTTINYSVIHDMMNETLTHTDSVIIRSVGNIGSRYNFGISEMTTVPFTSWYTGIFFVNLYKNFYNGAINDIPFKASQLTAAFNINNQFSFKNGWSAELSGNYTGKNREEGQAIVLPLGQVSAGVSKQLFNNKASIKMNIRDIFYTQNPGEIQKFQDVQSTLKITRDTRLFSIAFVYKLGVQPKSKSSTSQTEEQKRIQLN